MATTATKPRPITKVQRALLSLMRMASVQLVRRNAIADSYRQPRSLEIACMIDREAYRASYAMRAEEGGRHAGISVYTIRLRDMSEGIGTSMRCSSFPNLAGGQARAPRAQRVERDEIDWYDALDAARRCCASGGTDGTQRTHRKYSWASMPGWVR